MRGLRFNYFSAALRNSETPIMRISAARGRGAGARSKITPSGISEVGGRLPLRPPRSISSGLLKYGPPPRARVSGPRERLAGRERSVHTRPSGARGGAPLPKNSRAARGALLLASRALGRGDFRRRGVGCSGMVDL